MKSPPWIMKSLITRWKGLPWKIINSSEWTSYKWTFAWTSYAWTQFFMTALCTPTSSCSPGEDLHAVAPLCRAAGNSHKSLGRCPPIAATWNLSDLAWSYNNNWSAIPPFWFYQQALLQWWHLRNILVRFTHDLNMAADSPKNTTGFDGFCGLRCHCVSAITTCDLSHY